MTVPRYFAAKTCPALPKLLFVGMAVGFLSCFDFGALAADPGDGSSGLRQNLVHNGMERSYVIQVPRAVSMSSRRVPLVLVFHGGGGNAGNAESTTGFTDKARKEGFIVVYPEGSSRFGANLLTWNAGHCCGYAMQTRVDDVGFIGALIDKLLQGYPVDPKRIYATGISNGGMMSHRLGIELSDRFAAIAPVVGAVFGDERRPAHAVSAIMINGVLDNHVPAQGGPPGGRFASAWDGKPVRPAREQGVFWAAADGCANVPDENDRGQYTHWQYRCPAGRAVELYLVKDNGHAWPGGQSGSRMGDTPSTSLNGTDVIWEFFKAHAK